MEPSPEQIICASDVVKSSGPGRRFTLLTGDKRFSAFVIRYKRQVYGYINECQHQCLELDWNPGLFFDIEGEHLICATHGARYQPDTGLCVYGPCVGKSLTPVEIDDNGEHIYICVRGFEAETEFPEDNAVA